MSEEATIIQLLISETENKAIGEWGSRHPITNRAQAIRRLCRIGLTAAAVIDELEQNILNATLCMGNFMEKINSIQDSKEGIELANTEVSQLVETILKELFSKIDRILLSLIPLRHRTLCDYELCVIQAQEDEKMREELFKEYLDFLDKKGIKLTKQ